jgi:SAM-dependent methyltransferase
MPYSYESVVTGVCGYCGLIQRRTIEAPAETCPENTAFYNSDRETALNMLNQRSLFDTGRLSGYLDFILERVPRNSIHRALDAGCAEGLFSHVLASRLPGVAVHGADPDRTCIEYGQQRYPEVSLEHARIEHFTSTHRFDLITDFGAIYRCVEPMAVLNNYSKMLTPEGCLVIGLICSTQSLGDARSGVIPDNPRDLWPARGTDGIVRMIADPGIFKKMLEQCFEEVDLAWKRLTPYRKRAPFFFARKPRAEPLGTPEPTVDRPREGILFLKEYALRHSLQAVQELLEETQAQRVALYGVTKEGALLERLLDKVGVQVSYRIHPFAHKAQQDTSMAPIRFLNAVVDDPVDLVIIADYELQETYGLVIRTTGLDKEQQFFLGFQKQPDDPPLFAEIQGQQHLQKAFGFSRMSTARGR